MAQRRERRLYEIRANYRSATQIPRRELDTDPEPQKLAERPYIYIWPNKSEHHSGSTSLKVNGLLKLNIAASCVSHSTEEVQ